MLAAHGNTCQTKDVLQQKKAHKDEMRAAQQCSHARWHAIDDGSDAFAVRLAEGRHAEDRSKGGHIGGRRASKIEAGEREHDGLVRRGCARSVPAVGLSRREVVQEKRRYQQGLEPASSEGSAFPVQAVSPPLQGQRATGKEEDAADGVGCGDALVARLHPLLHGEI